MTAPQEDEAPAPEPLDDEGLPALTPDVIEDDELLGALIDRVVDEDPVARTRASEIATYQTWLRAAVEDAGTWGLYLDLASRQDQRWADLSTAIATWAFNEGRRFPITPQAGGPS